jgi:hypothetical protein
MDSLKYHSDPLCSTLLRPAGGPPLKRPYDRFRGDFPTGWAACSRLLPLRTSHAVRLRRHLTPKIFGENLFMLTRVSRGSEGKSSPEKKQWEKESEEKKFSDKIREMSP